MKKLSEDDIQGVIDASGLEKGEHNVTVTILLDEELYQTTSTITIPVNVKDLNEEEDNEDSEKSVVEENLDKTEKTSKKNQ